MTDFANARKMMVDNQLRTRNVTDRRLLLAMGDVPRERFVSGPRQSLAYIDEAHPIAGAPGRFLSAPAPLARLLQLAEIDGSDAVLDVGSGNGYSAAVLSKLAATVVAVESDSSLAAASRSTLSELGASNVIVVDGDPAAGAAGQGPFDVIIVEGSVREVPDALFGQLKDDGRIVALIARPGRPAVAHVFARSGKGVAARAEFDATLPPLPGALPKAESFVF
jgi:protein-L-isoaspartate(D-aspartate) O-methyltransferase